MSPSKCEPTEYLSLLQFYLSFYREVMSVVTAPIQDMAQATEEESERLLTELTQCIKSSCSEMKALIRVQETIELFRVEGLLTRLEKEITELKRSDVELEQLSSTQNHIHFLQVIFLHCN